MSFMDYYGKPYMKLTRQEQFIRYLNDTGASKAIQDALILLYRMPIKPSNLTKFFAEYFENGAKKSVAISLLRAELCYKHSQTQSMHKRLAFLEEQIRQLSPQDSTLLKKTTGNSDTDMRLDENNVPGHENFRLTFEGTQNGIQEHMLNRFLNDLDGAPRGSIADTSVSSRQSLAGKESNSSFIAKNESLELLETHNQPIIEDDSTLSVYSHTGIFQEQCAKEVEKDAFKNYQDDVKRLDPWGIVCRIPKRAPNAPHKPLEFESKADLFQDLSKPDLHVDLSVVSDHRSSAESEIEYKNYDSDDLETLAEIYQNQAVTEEILELPEDSSKAKILSVLSPLDHSHLSDILGWRPFSSTNTNCVCKEANKSEQNPPPCKSKADFCTSKKIKQCKQRNVFWPFENSYSGESPFKPTVDDSFLLKTNKGGGGGWGDNADDTQDFMSEFYQRHYSLAANEMESVCEKCCRPSRMSINKRVTLKESHGRIMQDEETMTEPAGECPCIRDQCDCDADCMPVKRSMIFGPRGVMSNWTRYSQEYPECMPQEGYYGFGETLGEAFERCVRDEEELKKTRALQKKFNEDFAVPLSPVRSDCLCNDSLTDIPPDVLNQCAEFYRQQEEDAKAQNSSAEVEEDDESEQGLDNDNEQNEIQYNTHGTMTYGSDQVLFDMIMAQKRKSSEQKEAELAKVFQDPDVYESKRATVLGGAGDGENVAQGMKNSIVPKRGSDAYELLDLDKEVRRTLGI